MNFFKILRMVKPIDWIIGLLLGTFILRIDFEKLWYTDVIYMATFALWFGQLVLRLYLQANQDKWK